MTTLYIRTPTDDPHSMSAEFPGFAECGATLIDAKEVTEAQALIWLGNRRCHVCFPGHAAHLTAGRRRAA